MWGSVRRLGWPLCRLQVVLEEALPLDEARVDSRGQTLLESLDFIHRPRNIPSK